MAPCWSSPREGDPEVQGGNPEVRKGITERGPLRAQNKLFEGNRRYSQEGETPEGVNGRRGQGRWPVVMTEGVTEGWKRERRYC